MGLFDFLRKDVKDTVAANSSGIGGGATTAYNYAVGTNTGAVPGSTPYQSQGTIELQKQERIPSPVLGYARGWAMLRGYRLGSLSYQLPEYDMAVISRLEDVESYILQGNLRKLAIMFKQGYGLLGKNPETIDYVKERFAEIDRAIPDDEEGFEELVVNSCSDLIRFSNCYWIKVRDKAFAPSAKKMRVIGGEKAPPIGAYFRIPAETVKLAYEPMGHVIAYRQQVPDGRHLEWAPADIIHFRFNRKRGLAIGTPILQPVKDDVKALREIEENVEILVHQHLFPLFQFIVGTDEFPATTMSDGTDEIAYWEAKIRHLPAEGCLVTSHRHEIKAIGAEGEALKVHDHLIYFRERIFGGMGMSGVDFGIGGTANKNTSDNMSQGLIDSVKLIQQYFEMQFNRRVIEELLSESGIADPLSEDNIVRLKFHEIDLDALIKIQNHANLMYQGHSLTRTEAREMMGFEAAEKKDEKDMYLQLVEIPLIEAKMGGMMELEEQKGQTQAAIATLKAKQQPSNQHGKNLGPTKRKSSAPSWEIWNDSFSSHYNDILQNVINRIHNNEDFTYIKTMVSSYEEIINHELGDRARYSFFHGIQDAGYGGPTDRLLLAAIEVIIDMGHRDIKRLLNDLNRNMHSQWSTEDKTSMARLIFDSAKYRAQLIDTVTNRRAYIYGKALAYKRMGVKELETVPHPESSRPSHTIDLTRFSFKDLPPVHPNDSSDVKPKE